MNQVVIVVVVVVAMREVVTHVLQLRLHLLLIQIIQNQNIPHQHKDMKHLHNHQQHINQNVSHVHSMLIVLMNVVHVKMVGMVMDTNVIIIVSLVIIGIEIAVFQRVVKRKMKVS